jgi:ribose/xylose/arabinose/galactoside ABC-type transport system permease subunit
MSMSEQLTRNVASSAPSLALEGQGATHRREDVARFMLRYSLPLVLLLFVVGLGLSNRTFFTFSNFRVILLEVSPIAFLAVGETMVILTGGIDLSVGAIVGLSGVVAALIAQNDGPWAATFAVAGGVAVGGLVGATTGFLVSVAKVPPFVASLGAATTALGFGYVFSEGRPISGLSDQFLAVSGGIGSVPIPIAAMVIVIALAWLALTRTMFGMHVYAVGGNPQAARVAGVKIRKIRFLVYTISGLLGGLSGVILCSRATAGIITTGSGYELNAIAAAVIGGVSLMGGRGSVLGAVLGFMILGVVGNGMNILNISPFYQLIIKGVIIVGAVFTDSYLNQERE